MPYTKTVWVNGVTAVAAPTMNNIEDGVEEAIDRLDLLEAEKIATYQFTGNIDATYAGEWDFILPAGVSSILSARLVVRGKSARDISSGAGGAFGDTGTASPPTSASGDHAHALSYIGVDTGVAEGHTHVQTLASFATSAGSHSHTVSSHVHNLAGHVHGITKGVSVATTPTGVNVYIDNGAGYGASVASGSDPVLIDTDIAASITATTDVKRIQITSTRLGMVDAVLMITAT